jgi:hypothetical protein
MLVESQVLELPESFITEKGGVIKSSCGGEIFTPGSLAGILGRYHRTWKGN